MANYARITGCGNNNVGVQLAIVGNLGLQIDSIISVGETVRLFTSGYTAPPTSLVDLGGCWVYNGSSTSAPGPGWGLVTGYPLDSMPIIGYGSGACQECASSVVIAACGDEPTTLYYGGQLTPFDVGKIFRTSSDFPPCVEIHSADNYFVEGTDPSWTYPNGPIAIPPAVQFFEREDCASCLASAKCIRLIDCATDGLIFDYYLENNIGNVTYPLLLSNLIGGVAQITIPNYMINEVTGVPEAVEFTACFKIQSSSRDVDGSPGCGIQNALVVDVTQTTCDTCNHCFNMTACDNSFEIYKAYATTTNGLALYTQVQSCLSLGKVATIRIDLQDGLGYRCFQITTPCSTGQVLYLDPLAPLAYQLFCDDVPCILCSGGSGPAPTCYQVTFCETNQVLILQDPINIASPIPIGNYFQGSVILSNGTPVIGCFTIMATNCTSTNPVPITGAEIIFDDITTSYDDCLACNPPPAYILTRCDDPGVFFIINNFALTVDLATLVGKVIRNITLANCSTGTTPCFIKPEQCWLVELYGTDPTVIALLSYDDRPTQIFTSDADTDACECCLEKTYIPPTE